MLSTLLPPMQEKQVSEAMTEPNGADERVNLARVVWSRIGLNFLISRKKCILRRTETFNGDAFSVTLRRFSKGKFSSEKF